MGTDHHDNVVACVWKVTTVFMDSKLHSRVLDTENFFEVPVSLYLPYHAMHGVSNMQGLPVEPHAKFPKF